MCTGANSLLGTVSPHPLSYMMMSTCMLLTMATRIAGLVMAIMYQYKIISIIYPPQDITDEMSGDGCDWLSVLGEEGVEVYRKNSMVYQQVDGEGKLMYSNKGWKVWETTGDLISMDTFHMQDGNIPYGTTVRILAPYLVITGYLWYLGSSCLFFLHFFSPFPFFYSLLDLIVALSFTPTPCIFSVLPFLTSLLAQPIAP